MSWLTNKRCCVVPGCTTKAKDPGRRFKIPSDPRKGIKWLEAIKSEELLNRPYAELSGKYCVCYKHFGDKDWITKNDGKPVTNSNAIPTLYLPECMVPWQRSSNITHQQVQEAAELRLTAGIEQITQMWIEIKKA